MITIVWEFVVAADSVAEFERHYAPGGAWAQLFARAGADYLGTALLHDAERPGRYLTFDRWASRAAWEEFRRAHAADYAALDRMCENLTVSERRIGLFEEAED